ncbi:MAG: TRAP transporter large permease [Candidatus Eisenbacteria bacterium]|nr:TRAP transporter large permease [Candidatus Eisenbacteria bacterium]MCC7141481.1 TRAP transporter large permease [Candidatus Eisenbacteria bacterium]
MNLLVALGLVLVAILGAPLFSVLAGSALFAFWRQEISSSAVVTEMARLATSPILISIPMFTFAGYLFAESRTPQRLVRVTSAFFGWIPGSLAIVAMVACAIFTAFTGGSGVTIVAMGGLLMPALMAVGFRERYSLGLLTTSGSLGFLFPPSLPMILYSFVATQAASGLGLPPGATPDVDKLFLAGLLPGVFLIALLGVMAVAQGRGREVQRTSFREGMRDLWPAVKEAAWEIPLPFIILGGIFGGKLTVTEAATVTAIYALLVEVVIYRDIKWSRIPAIATESMTLVGAILMILGSAMGLTNYLIDAEVPMRVLEWIRTFITNKITFLLVLNVFLLIIGSLMEIFSALIVIPLILPIALEYDVDLVHLGIIFLTNLEIGFLTPPFGLNLFISSFRFRRSVTEVYRATVPFLIVLAIALLVITYWPDLSLWLPRLYGKGSALPGN